MKRSIFAAALVAFGIFCAPNSASAQREQTLLGGSTLRFTGAWGGTNHYYEPVGDLRKGYSASYVALEFNKAFNLGYSRTRLDATGLDNTANSDFALNYRSFVFNATPFASSAIHPIVGISVGGGDLRNRASGRTNVVVWQPSAGVEFNVARWFHLSLTGGYRGVEFRDSNQSALFSKEVSGMYGELGLRFGWSWGKSKRHYSRDDD